MKRIVRNWKRNLFLLAGILTAGVISYWWLRIFLSRYFDPDELTHLHWAWLMFKGERPYKDFFYVMVPFFNFLFYPLFLVFGESISVLIFARVVIFVIYLLTAGAVFLLGREIFGKKAGLLAVIIFLSMPMGFAKQMEIRPDNLSVVFFVLGVWAFFKGFCKAEFKSCKAEFKWFFWSGLFLGANAVVMPKGALSIIALLLAAVFWVGLFKRREFLKIFGRIFLGMTIPVLILLIYLLVGGILIEGLRSIIIFGPLHLEGIWPTSFWWYLKPNDIYYTGYKNFPWYFNLFLLSLALVAVLVWVGRALRAKKLEKEAMGALSLFLMAIFLILTLSPLQGTFLQYYLPILPLLCVLTAGGVLGLLWALRISKNWLGLVICVCFLGACLFSSWQIYRVRKYWTNESHLEHVFNYLKVSKSEDRVFDFWGMFVFRKDGYFVCCENFPKFTKRLKMEMPDFIEEMKKNENKFITYDDRREKILGDRVLGLRPEERQFLRENYVPIGVELMRVVGREFNFGEGLMQRAEIFVAGNYRVVGKEIMIDGKRYEPGEVLFLGKGVHEFGGRGKAIVRYNWEGERKEL